MYGGSKSYQWITMAYLQQPDWAGCCLGELTFIKRIICYCHCIPVTAPREEYPLQITHAISCKSWAIDSNPFQNTTLISHDHPILVSQAAAEIAARNLPNRWSASESWSFLRGQRQNYGTELLAAFKQFVKIRVYLPQRNRKQTSSLNLCYLRHSYCCTNPTCQRLR